MLKTEYKYIRFERPFPTADWECWNGKDTMLGVCVLNQRWKEYEFCPEESMGFTNECLRDIADFLEQLNKERKAKASHD
jgi:hypothetical protein